MRLRCIKFLNTSLHKDQWLKLKLIFREINKQASKTNTTFWKATLQVVGIEKLDGQDVNSCQAVS